jgi:dipeptide/tripeptide permease
MAYSLPIFGAWVADTKIGRYPAILLGVLICGVAHIIQVFGALPKVLQSGDGLAPFLISVFILAIGAGNDFNILLSPCIVAYYDRHFQAEHSPNGHRSVQTPKTIYQNTEDGRMRNH